MEIKYEIEKTFTFKEVEFKSTQRKIKSLTVQAPAFQDRYLLIEALPENPSTKDSFNSMVKLAVKKTGLTIEEFMELPEPVANAVLGFITPTAE
ncbi:hypothetical protein M2305_003242 [Gluconobacter cerinus]|uniref:hypothetical protein n=1 Tax=Gluconobacter cerinus TaxID=38307 RepID=UPI002226024F|nr:hypothetical protein [Gluconobacter cerinus]MCW2267223.1 hypothetical protein [Gluconobacter cerinus]